MSRRIFAFLAAVLGFAFAFRSQRLDFWHRMALVAGSLGGLAFAQAPHAFRPALRRSDLGIGMLSAGLLYLVFLVGDRFARAAMPSGRDNITAIYELRRQASVPTIAFLLATIIAPAEEIFWRGFIQRYLQQRYRGLIAVPLAAGLYAAVHLSSWNPTLVGAAGVAGLFWGWQYSIQKRLAPVIISHMAWDIWIFLIAPTSGRGHSTR